MPTKHVVIVASGLVVAALAFAFVYQRFTQGLDNATNENTEMGAPSHPSANTKSGSQSPTAENKPVTPDSAADDIINQASGDETALDNVASDEKTKLDAGNAAVNDLGTTYDENAAQ